MMSDILIFVLGAGLGALFSAIICSMTIVDLKDKIQQLENSRLNISTQAIGFIEKCIEKVDLLIEGNRRIYTEVDKIMSKENGEKNNE